MADYFDTSEDITLDNGDNFHVYRAGFSKGPTIVLLHGAGYTSMTWSIAIKYLKERCSIIAFDFRGHGLTHARDENNLSIDTLVHDAIQVINTVIDKYYDRTEAIILVGHSLGGSVAVRVASEMRAPSISGVMVIDVVEGTALASLEHMHVILRNRPEKFDSLEDAVSWSLQSGTVRNADAARISIPAQLKQDINRYIWRTNLADSKIYWEGWFKGLSEQFLSLPIPKILALAGFDRLDTALIRGQMQGKFELKLIYGTGHAIQEDCPEKFAAAVHEFYQRCSPSSHGIPEQGTVLAERLAKARAMMPQSKQEVDS